MKGLKIAAMIMVTAVLAGCNTLSYSTVPSAVPGQQVRLVTMQDADGNVVGSFHELYDMRTMEWFEAQANATGGWELTTAGKMAQQQANSGGDSGGGGGGC